MMVFCNIIYSLVNCVGKKCRILNPSIELYLKNTKPVINRCRIKELYRDSCSNCAVCYYTNRFLSKRGNSKDRVVFACLLIIANINS